MTVPLLQSHQINAGPLTGFRNAIINPDFEIAQRGTTHSTSGYGSLDRWRLTVGSGATTSMTQTAFTVGQTDVPGSPKYYLAWARSVAGSAQSEILQRIEDTKNFSGELMTLTFWVKASAATEMNVAITQNFGTGGSPSGSAAQTILSGQAITTSWVKVSVTFTMTSVSGKTFGTDDNSYIALRFIREHTATNPTATVDIAHISLVRGDATNEDDPTSMRHIHQELALCKRYLQILGSAYIGPAVDATRCYIVGRFEVEMRDTPTMTLTDTVVSIHDGVTGRASSSASVTDSFIDRYGFAVRITGFTSLTAYRPFYVRQGEFMQADAEF